MIRGSELRRRLEGALHGPGDTSDFDLDPQVTRPAAGALRPAAVLVAVQADGWVWLTRRSARLQDHAGQIAFPGGKFDQADGDAETCALREAFEEIGLARDCVEVLGTMPCHETVTGFTVTPVLGWLAETFMPVAEAEEVEEVFAVPFAHIADPAHYRVESRLWDGRRRYFYILPYGPYCIWGATARILRALADRSRR